MLQVFGTCAKHFPMVQRSFLYGGYSVCVFIVELWSTIRKQALLLPGKLRSQLGSQLYGLLLQESLRAGLHLFQAAQARCYAAVSTLGRSCRRKITQHQ